MAGPGPTQETQEEIVARDDAHLQSLGIKPQLNRSLGFLANFALAFSFISVSTGSFGNFGVGLGLGGPMMFWTWIIIVLGQTLVALGFAELASHYPVAGSIYQWSKRLSHRTLGWFTGWFYFWAQVVTVTAVACIVAFVVDGVMGQKDFLASPSPLGVSDMFTFIAITTLVITTSQDSRTLMALMPMPSRPVLPNPTSSSSPRRWASRSTSTTRPVSASRIRSPTVAPWTAA